MNWITVKEAVQLLDNRATATTIRYWVRAKKITTMRIGAKILIDKDSLLRMVRIIQAE